MIATVKLLLLTGLGPLFSRYRRRSCRLALGRSLFLLGLLLLSFGIHFLVGSHGGRLAAQTNTVLNPIQLENQQMGSADWVLTQPARHREIEGYASLTSVNRGESIQLFVNTTAPRYTIEIFRMGWYGGVGARRMTDPISRTGIQQPPPHVDTTTGLIECDWREPYRLTIPDWVSGVYLAKLTASHGPQSYILFVVREDDRPSDYVAQSSVTTFQAYNNWGGKSLYQWNSEGRAHKVSFNRPYAISPNPEAAYGVGAGEFLVNLQPPHRVSSAGWEYNWVRWLERNGYDVSYVTNVDTHANPTLLRSHRVFLSLGHDEYWSWDMRQQVEAARDAGVSLGFFSANTCYWQIRFESSRLTRDPYRTLVAYKERAALDPMGRDRSTENDHLVTTLWRAPPVNRPEAALLGVMYGLSMISGDLHLAPSVPAWVLANTGLAPSAVLSGLLGYEVDHVASSSPHNTVILAHSPYLHHHQIHYADTTLYQADSGAWVFAAGTMQWSWGLDDYNAPGLRLSYSHPGLQQMTRNILEQLRQPSIPRQP